MSTSRPCSDSPEFVRVLLISSLSRDEISLRHILNHSKWVLQSVPTCRDALAYARGNDTVVICERDLPDGDWKYILSEFERLPSRPNLIVTSQFADDELWAEVLNLGGYDVLAQPFDSDEVYRVIFLAWQEQKRRNRTSVEPEYSFR